jgi:threonine dehydrogenase-like Zn-dependent dehydrogenase
MATEAARDRNSVLIIGTGYVGGSVLNTILNRRDRHFKVTAVTPNPDEAGKLQEMGVRPVIANLDETGVLESEAAKHHVSCRSVLFSCNAATGLYAGPFHRGTCKHSGNHQLLRPESFAWYRSNSEGYSGEALALERRTSSHLSSHFL